MACSPIKLFGLYNKVTTSSRLINDIYPKFEIGHEIRHENNQYKNDNKIDIKLNSSKLQLLQDYILSNPQNLPEICEYIENLFKNYKITNNYEFLFITLEIVKEILNKCIDMNLVCIIDPSIINILFQLLQSNDNILINEGALFFFEYSEICNKNNFSIFLNPIIELCNNNDNEYNIKNDNEFNNSGKDDKKIQINDENINENSNENSYNENLISTQLLGYQLLIRLIDLFMINSKMNIELHLEVIIKTVYQAISSSNNENNCTNNNENNNYNNNIQSSSNDINNTNNSNTNNNNSNSSDINKIGWDCLILLSSIQLTDMLLHIIIHLIEIFDQNKWQNTELTTKIFLLISKSAFLTNNYYAPIIHTLLTYTESIISPLMRPKNEKVKIKNTLLNKLYNRYRKNKNKSAKNISKNIENSINNANNSHNDSGSSSSIEIVENIMGILNVIEIFIISLHKNTEVSGITNHSYSNTSNSNNNSNSNDKNNENNKFYQFNSTYHEDVNYLLLIQLYLCYLLKSNYKINEAHLVLNNTKHNSDNSSISSSNNNDNSNNKTSSVYSKLYNANQTLREYIFDINNNSNYDDNNNNKNNNYNTNNANTNNNTSYNYINNNQINSDLIITIENCNQYIWRIITLLSRHYMPVGHCRSTIIHSILLFLENSENRLILLFGECSFFPEEHSLEINEVLEQPFSVVSKEYSLVDSIPNGNSNSNNNSSSVRNDVTEKNGMKNGVRISLKDRIKNSMKNSMKTFKKSDIKHHNSNNIFDNDNSDAYDNGDYKLSKVELFNNEYLTSIENEKNEIEIKEQSESKKSNHFNEKDEYDNNTSSLENSDKYIHNYVDIESNNDKTEKNENNIQNNNNNKDNKSDKSIKNSKNDFLNGSIETESGIGQREYNIEEVIKFISK